MPALGGHFDRSHQELLLGFSFGFCLGSRLGFCFLGGHFGFLGGSGFSFCFFCSSGFFFLGGRGGSFVFFGHGWL
ncbi:MAG: hypothetical protein ACREXG_03805, partial [Polaromonas sp.]